MSSILKTLQKTETGFQEWLPDAFPDKQEKFQPPREIIYPEDDGKPMAENTEQFNWITKIKDELEILFADNPDVFIAGDLLWYPQEGDNKTCLAPDVMVAFERPKGFRSSYLQWKEGNIPPQAVFEILSPSNTKKEMRNKLKFYEKYGVEEYYVYDPDNIAFEGRIRCQGRLQEIKNIQEWQSPRLNVRFELTDEGLRIIGPDGCKFMNGQEREHLAKTNAVKERQKADAKLKQERVKAGEKLKQERLKAGEKLKQERLKADAKLKQERKRIEILEAKLKEAGLSLDEI